MGLQPGPMLFKEHADFVWGFIGSIWVANFLGLILVLAFAPAFAAILRIKFSILMPIIIYVCAIGAFAVNNRMIDIYYMIIFGIVGYLFKKLDYPMAPMVLALVLGNLAESAARQALIMGHGNPLIFFRPPIALPLMLIALFLFFWPTISKWRKRSGAKKGGYSKTEIGISGKKKTPRWISSGVFSFQCRKRNDSSLVSAYDFHLRVGTGASTAMALIFCIFSSTKACILAICSAFRCGKRP